MISIKLFYINLDYSFSIPCLGMPLIQMRDKLTGIPKKSLSNEHNKENSKMRRVSLIILFVIFTFFSLPLHSQETSYLEFPMSEMDEKWEELNPTEEDYIFHKPNGWSDDLIEAAIISSYSQDEIERDITSIIDGNPYTTWASQRYASGPEITFDLGEPTLFNRIVFYNRFTENRGTGGGNNATQEIEVSVSDSADSSYASIENFTLKSPTAVCFLSDEQGRICTFINTASPNIFEIEDTRAQYIKLKFISAYWGKFAKDDWKTSISLSEFMIFYCKTKAQ